MVIYEAYKEFFRDVLIPDEIAKMEARVGARCVINMGSDLGLSDDIIDHIVSNVNCSLTDATKLFNQYGNARIKQDFEGASFCDTELINLSFKFLKLHLLPSG